MSSDDDEHGELQKEFDTLMEENRKLKQQTQKVSCQSLLELFFFRLSIKWNFASNLYILNVPMSLPTIHREWLFGIYDRYFIIAQKNRNDDVKSQNDVKYLA